MMINLSLKIISIITIFWGFVQIAYPVEVHSSFDTNQATNGDFYSFQNSDSATIRESIDNQTALASTQPLTHVIYLPFIFSNYCEAPIVADELIRYNISIISAPNGWQKHCTGGEDVIVAVLDTGVDIDHPDLEDNLVTGQSFVPYESSVDDGGGHGTHVASIVAGVANNGGVVGVAPRAKIMPVKVLDSSGSGSTSWVAGGIDWAANNGADVINMSLGSISNSAAMADAVNNAYQKGILLVAAAGNCGDFNYFANGCFVQDQTVYPGAYSTVIAVASTSQFDNQSSFSNQGSYVEIAAPGSFIYGAYPGATYQSISGTSQAAPHVAGLAALIWSVKSDLAYTEVRNIINNTADDLGTFGWDSTYGYGRINVEQALGNLSATSGSAAGPSQVTALDAAPAPVDAPFVPGRVLVKFKPGYTLSDALNEAEMTVANVVTTDVMEGLDIQTLSVAVGQEKALAVRLNQSEAVLYAELDYVVTLR